MQDARSIKSLWTLFVCVFSACVLAACSEDDATTSADTSGPADTNTSGTTNTDTSGATNLDTSGTSGTTSTDTSGTTADTSGVTSDDTSGVTDNDTSGATTDDTSGATSDDTSGTTSDDTSGATDDTSGATDTTNDDTSGSTSGATSGTEVTYPDSPAAYVAGDETAQALSFITALTVPPTGDLGATCCFKFPSSLYPDEPFDNGLSYLAPVLEGFLEDDQGNPLTLSTYLNDRIAAGLTVYLLDHIHFAGAEDADGFVLASLRGAFAAGTTFDGAGGTRAASSGAGEFWVDAASFMEGSGEPSSTFEVPSVTGGHVEAGPGSLVLELPLLFVNLNYTVLSARIEGHATLGADGVTYIDGLLSGYITEADMITVANDAARVCECLGLNGSNLIVPDTNGWICSIPIDRFGACAGDPNPSCAEFGSDAGSGLCAFVDVMSGLMDLDLSGDGRGDALSIGLGWSAVGGEVTGLVP